MNRLLAAAILFASLTIPSTLRAENLLTNPGFERDLAGWTVAAYPGLSVVWENYDALGDSRLPSGSVALFFDGVDRTASLSRVSQTIPVTPNAEYAFGAKIRLASNPADATAFVAMFWKRADGLELYQGETAVVAIDSAWVSTSARAVAPADAASVQVRLYIREVKGTVVSFDDVFVQRISGAICPVSCASSVVNGAPVGEPVGFGAAFHPTCETQPEVLWDFGDSFTSNVPDALHVYSWRAGFRWTLSRVFEGQSCVATGTIAIDNVPLISFFTASPSTVLLGEPVVLSWSTIGATTVSIDGGIGTVPASGTMTVHPRGPGLYTLRATNVAGTSEAQVLIGVSASRRRAVRR